MSKWNFDKAIKNLEQVKKELPPILANDALRYFNRTFVEGGWDGKKWQEPQRKKPGTKAYKYPKKGATARRSRATLVGTGRLRRTVAGSLVNARFESIKFRVALPYAARHNEGLAGMPQRKFMGDSVALRKLQRDKIIKAINSIWQG